MKKLSNVLLTNTEESYKKFISEKVLSDKEIIKFIKENYFTLEDIEKNHEIFYQYYISKDKNLDLNHIPKLLYRDNKVYITYNETDEYRNYRQSLQLNSKIKTEFVPSKILTYTFENLSKNKEKAKVAIECIRICNSILNEVNMKGLYIYGSTGVGKTYFMGCIYNHFKENGIEPAIIYYPEFVRKIKTKISNNEYEQYIDIIRAEKILIIDDIGAENITEFIRDEILGPIINYREAENLPTFFSSNLSFSDLLAVLSKTKNSVDQTKALRIVERIKSLSTPLLLKGQNERELYN
ncbi:MULTISPECIES: primosomal protein DnaI [Gemella]|uniref:primosomal protein DnaI n=1 Tax=Gemella TaxID=1378 RepID=UPI0007681B88|nr:MULTISPECIES: primosomal protein DnaI [Gemella]AME09276.1 prepilin peptidase [Gemella sp. oral taxon 928]AXI26910.1 prepilin peptidase [Gemella sp. ND 6198]